MGLLARTSPNLYIRKMKTILRILLLLGVAFYFVSNVRANDSKAPAPKPSEKSIHKILFQSEAQLVRVQSLLRDLNQHKVVEKRALVQNFSRSLGETLARATELKEKGLQGNAEWAQLKESAEDMLVVVQMAEWIPYKRYIGPLLLTITASGVLIELYSWASRSYMPTVPSNMSYVVGGSFILVGAGVIYSAYRNLRPLFEDMLQLYSGHWNEFWKEPTLTQFLTPEVLDLKKERITNLRRVVSGIFGPEEKDGGTEPCRNALH